MQQEVPTSSAAASASSPPAKPDVIELTTKAQFNEIISNTTTDVFVVDFYTTWCGPCKRIAPEIAKLALRPEYQSVHFCKIDAENPEMESVAEACKVEAFPTFCFFREGKVIDKIEGGPVGRIVQILNKNV